MPSAAQPEMESAASTRTNPEPEQPVRFLLVRQKGGPLPWFVQALELYMAPARVIQVIGMANALWRLGHERFDGVLLDAEAADTAVIARCREQIADVAAVPVLNIHEAPTAAHVAPPPRRPARHAERQQAQDQQALRLPWLRRSKRDLRHTPPEALSVG